MKILTLIDIQSMSISEIYEKYNLGFRLEGFGNAVHNLSPAICTKTNGIVGDIVHLKATPTGGTPNYTVEFYKDSTLLTTFAGVANGVQKLYDYILVNADVGSKIFKTRILDSCPSGAKICTEQCTVTVAAACIIPSCNFVVE